MKNREALMGSVMVLFAALAILTAGCQNGLTGAEEGETASANIHDHATKTSLSKPGFVTVEEEGRLWVLRPGEKKSEKHITLVGAGPMGMTIKALEKKTALEYIATKKGFDAVVDEDGRIWIYAEGTAHDRSDKHITRVGAGPLGTTLKALDRKILDAYMETGT